MQGYHVPLDMQDSILEEDAAAIAAQDAAVKYGGQLSKDAFARNQPINPGLLHGPVRSHAALHSWPSACERASP